MTENEKKKQQLVADVLIAHLNGFPWKPEYDGMTAWGMAGKILSHIRFADMPEEEDCECGGTTRAHTMGCVKCQ